MAISGTVHANTFTYLLTRLTYGDPTAYRIS